jgi:hypothetical protein
MSLCTGRVYLNLRARFEILQDGCFKFNTQYILSVAMVGQSV